jgi:deazaflavin-dependent oxidoreductase (nitroreductase family)
MSRLVSGVRSLGHKRWFARAGRILVPVDRALGILTKGRFVAFGVRDLPSMLITTTGRKSGRHRTNPLLYARDGDGFVVIGSNWGRDHHPAWALNLIANPVATVTLGGKAIPVRATLAEGAERERLLGLLMSLWPAYATYEKRAGGRELRVFRLTAI